MSPATGTASAECVAAEYQALAAALSGLPEAAWDAPSLCAGWRVREVIAHVTMPVRYSTPRFLAELARSRGNFAAMADRCARRDAAASPAELLFALRDPRLHAWKPPRGGYQGALVHAVIHGLDVTTPLELGYRVAEDRIRIVLDGVTTGQSPGYFGVDLGGIELRASDIGWSAGSGALLTGTASDLALAATGRVQPAGRLRGEAAARFAAR